MYHIVFLSPHSDPQAKLGELDSGGQCIYEHELAQALSSVPEFRVTTFCRQTGQRPDISQVNNSYTIKRIHCGPPGIVPKEEIERELEEFTEKVAQELQNDNEDDAIILHGHYWDGGYVALALKAQWPRKLPFLWTPHSLGSLKRRKFLGSHNEFHYNFIPRQCWEGYTLHVADKVIVSSEKEKETAVEDYAVSPEKVVVISPGVDLQQFQAVDQRVARQKFQLPEQGKILLGLGRMVRNKGYHHSLAAFEALRRKYTEPLYLALFGGSPNSTSPEESAYRQELETMIQEKGLQEVAFLRPAVAHEEIHEVFSAADVFLMSSEHEPFGLVTLEAMAIGLPVVAANSGGSLSIITPNRTGILTDFHQPERVASYILSLLLDAETATAMGEAAQRHIRREYDWRQKSEQVSQVYRQISRDQPEEFFQTVLRDNFFLQQHFAGER